jgi:protein O-mannosyl-transferase
MAQKSKIKPKKNLAPPATAKKTTKEKSKPVMPWWLIAMTVTAICFFPMLKNEFTNWDDDYYVVENALLRGPDWKGIFTQPVVSNYHPLTVASLAFNYQLSQLDPTSYFIVNYLLHLINTILVFYFIWNISGVRRTYSICSSPLDKKIWPSFFAALIFGVHPMHVESVAWISERKDVLYTLFFLLSLIQYWSYLQTKRSSKLWFAFFLFALSLLSKPAAIILPLVLLLLDYWKGRRLDSKAVVEKIPFFILALIFAIATVQIQSAKAIAGLDLYPLWTRPVFACYVVMIYFLRFFVPYPLSAFHPYPQPTDLGWAVYISPLFIIAAAIFIWLNRKNKLLVFCSLFFVVNLLLVMQVISIGTTIVSERYTYVPYIGLAFLFGMMLNNIKQPSLKKIAWAFPLLVVVALGYMTFERTQVWRNSGTLWDDAIAHYPNAPVARTNRANYLLRRPENSTDSNQKRINYQRALEDCNVALKNNPNHKAAYEDRQFIYFNTNRNEETVADATALIKLDPESYLAYANRGAAYVRLKQPDKALADLNKSLSLKPDNVFSLDMRAVVLYSDFKQYDKALADYNRLIQLSPQTGNYYLNRSYCYYMLQDMNKAKADVQTALQKGMAVPENYKKSVGL